MKKLLITTLIVLFAAARLAAAPLEEGENKVSSLMLELMKMHSTPETQTVLCWMPAEYWKAAMSVGKPAATKESQNVAAIIDAYMVVLVAKLNKGPHAAQGFASLDELTKDARLLIPGTEGLVPLGEDQQTPELKKFLREMQPVMGKTLGPLGEGLHFLVFPSKDKAGKRLADPTASGKLALTINGHIFTWHLPLGSLMPPKKCEKCGETFKGDFLFCPYDGTALKTGPGTEPK